MYILYAQSTIIKGTVFIGNEKENIQRDLKEFREEEKNDAD